MVRTQQAMEEQRKEAIGDIAHELRTPLATIRAWLEAVRDGVAEYDEALARSLLEEALHLQRTVDDLQLLSLAEAGRLQLHREVVDLGSLLEQARTALSELALRGGVALEVSGPGRAVIADPGRVRQMIENLVTNAVRHSPAGATVAVRAAVDRRLVRIDVTDHGSGIAAGDLDHVFDRFWRAEKSRGRAAGGSGLGLAIVRQLAELHGGTVTVASTPGQETTFSVLLPGAVPSEDARDPSG